MDTSFVQESVLTLTETNDRLVLRVTSLEDRETISEWNITSINEFAHEIQDEVKVLQAQVATLQSQVAYLLSLHSEPRLDALESGLQYANANITDIHAVDAMLTNRTTVLERRADNHEARVEVLEADDVQAHYNISRLVGRADVDEYNISVLKARADANDVFVYDIYLNLTGTANTTSVLVLRSENGLSRIAALENYTVPE